MIRGKRLFQRLVLALLLVGASLAVPAAEQRGGVKFDHTRTGFLLTGGHSGIECESCHVRGVFRGTPRECSICHSPGSGIATTYKTTTHIPTTLPCEQCHRNSATWTGARFSHTGVGPGSCASCHNGRTATGKPNNHIATAESCDACHRTTAWIPANRFNHTGVAPGTCVTCHNGSRAPGKGTCHIQTTASCDQCHSYTTPFTTRPSNSSIHLGVIPGGCATCHNGNSCGGAPGKPPGHVITTSPCDTCHRTTAWIPANFNHASVTPGTCSSCHNGTTATGKGTRHIPTSASCDQCHYTTYWKPTKGRTAVHTGVAPTTCGTCHNGSYDGARGKPNGHVVTTQPCDVCHNMNSWIPASFSHTGVTPGTCLSCHGVSATGKPAAHIPATMSCDACHGTTTFSTSTMRNHTAAQGVVPGGCVTCHSGAYKQDPYKALGKPSGHPSTSNTCDASGCHTTRTFSK